MREEREMKTDGGALRLGVGDSIDRELFVAPLVVCLVSCLGLCVFVCLSWEWYVMWFHESWRLVLSTCLGFLPTLHMFPFHLSLSGSILMRWKGIQGDMLPSFSICQLLLANARSHVRSDASGIPGDTQYQPV